MTHGLTETQRKAMAKIRAQLAEVTAALDGIESCAIDGIDPHNHIRIIRDHTDGYWHAVQIGNSTDWRDILYPGEG